MDTAAASPWLIQITQTNPQLLRDSPAHTLTPTLERTRWLSVSRDSGKGRFRTEQTPGPGGARPPELSGNSIRVTCRTWPRPSTLWLRVTPPHLCGR